MPDLRLEIILIGLVIIGAILLIISYIWVFIIQRSPLRLIMLVLGNALNRDRVADPNAPIEIPQDPTRADALAAQSQALKNSEMFFDAPLMPQAQSLGAPPPQVVPRAPLVETDLHVADETTSDNGWPIRLDKATRQSQRPFLNIHLKSNQDPEPDPNSQL